MKTIWQEKIQNFNKLSKSIATDVCIIGGGITGLWCAYHLALEGKKVCILEAKRIASGTTGGTSAIFTTAQDDIYKTLIKKHGLDAAKRYYKDTKNAIKEIIELAKINKWDIDLEPINYTLFTTKFWGRISLKGEQKAYKKMGLNIPRHATRATPLRKGAFEDMGVTGLPFRVKRALIFGESYQFNPIKLVKCLVEYLVKKGVAIYENTHIRVAPENGILKFEHIEIKAEKFVVATHFPYINLPGFYWLKMYQSMNFCIAYKKEKQFENFCNGEAFESIDVTKGLEYRSVDDKILVDGVSTRTGENQYKSKYKVIEKHISKYFGDVKEVTRYVAQDCITLDGLPYAGLYSHFDKNIFVIAGFNKWGIANSYACAKVLFDKNTIYSPQRGAIFANIIETVHNVAAIGASFVNVLACIDAKKIERIQKGQGAIVKHKGKRIGVHKTLDGKVHMIHAVCPHLGCNLKWNKDECTFDCPCHGSRFTSTGEILNNPSIDKLEVL